MSFTMVLMPAGSTTTVWPLRTMPLAICPLRPRKSCRCGSVGLFGRFTHWTGKRSALRFQSLAMWTVSRCASRVGPSYHGVRLDGPTTLSPLSALIGMNFTSRNTSSFGMKSSNSSRISRIPVLAPIHQIHLVHRDDQVRNAEQRGDIGVAAALLNHALARVHEHDGQVGGARRR